MNLLIDMSSQRNLHLTLIYSIHLEEQQPRAYHCCDVTVCKPATFDFTRTSEEDGRVDFLDVCMLRDVLFFLFFRQTDTKTTAYDLWG